MAWGRCQARRWFEVEGRAGRRRQGSGPVVAGGSRKIVNSDWREVDEGHLPVPYRSDGSLKNRLTYLFSVDCYLRYDNMGGVLEEYLHFLCSYITKSYGVESNFVCHAML